MGRLMASPLAFGGSCVRGGGSRVGSVRKGRPLRRCPLREAFGRWTQGTLEDTQATTGTNLGEPPLPNPQIHASELFVFYDKKK
jgi:hypothetical protein